MTQPKLSLRDIWRILIFGLAQDFESVSYMEYSHAKNNLDFHRNSRSCNGCFDWCIGFLNCTDTSIQRQNVSIIIMKMGTGQFAPFRWTNENLCDMRRTFKMSDGKKQKATKLPQNFCCSACGKEMPRLAGLGNRCTSISCHSATMPILAMRLIGRCNWNGNCYGK